jgi:spore coat protein CotH
MKLLNFVPLVCILAALFFAPMQLAAQNFYEPTQVNTIHLYFSEANWDQLLDNLASAGQEERLTGSAIINGVPYDSVGVRYKGNSLTSSWITSLMISLWTAFTALSSFPTGSTIPP